MSYTADNHVDDHVDEEIQTCLDLDKPVSFFLFAGAGSGKTRSLVTALVGVRSRFHGRLRMRGQRIGVITYTNAACDEIKNRIESDALIEVSTIHSFLWSLINGFNADIRKWLHTELQNQIADLEERQRKGRGGKAASDREESIKAKQKRLGALPHVGRFTYNPSGDNRGRDSLNHSEVVKIGSDFLMNKPVMQQLLISRFPILLIDESQDTNKLLIEAILKLQQTHKDKFCLGLFGDTMQRIYGDGKDDLGRSLPVDWAKPAKKMNHRSPRRVIRLINRIRSAVDDQEQTARTDSEEGTIRLFVLPGSIGDKAAAELNILREMADVTGDPLWESPLDVKTLILEHHMAARRMGFLEMFQPLYEVENLQTGLRDGSLAGLRFFSHLVLPTVAAKARGDEFALAATMRSTSPLLSGAALIAAGADQRAQIRLARRAVDELAKLCSNGNPQFMEVLQNVASMGMFEIPECLQHFAHADGNNPSECRDVESGEEDANAWGRFLSTPFRQIESYDLYVRGLAPFETHQGVKGREFPRVMVVMDDAEARGFMFSYEKLFAAKEKTKTDIENEREGKDSSIARTRRLFYVTCSRARQSLAIVAYSADPSKVCEHVLREEWLEDHEIRMM
jgi:DNA helicase-2/ATP-dependent DNA helicase PcrA